MVSPTMNADHNPDIGDADFLNWLAALTQEPAAMFHKSVLTRLMKLAGADGLAYEVENGARKQYQFAIGALVPYIDTAIARLPQPSLPPEP